MELWHFKHASEMLISPRIEFLAVIRNNQKTAVSVLIHSKKIEVFWVWLSIMVLGLILVWIQLKFSFFKCFIMLGSICFLRGTAMGYCFLNENGRILRKKISCGTCELSEQMPFLMCQFALCWHSTNTLFAEGLPNSLNWWCPASQHSWQYNTINESRPYNKPANRYHIVKITLKSTCYISPQVRSNFPGSDQ